MGKRVLRLRYATLRTNGGSWLESGLEQQGESLRAVVKGMETVIERTAPKG